MQRKLRNNDLCFGLRDALLFLLALQSRTEARKNLCGSVFGSLWTELQCCLWQVIISLTVNLHEVNEDLMVCESYNKKHFQPMSKWSWALVECGEMEPTSVSLVFRCIITLLGPSSKWDVTTSGFRISEIPNTMVTVGLNLKTLDMRQRQKMTEKTFTRYLVGLFSSAQREVMWLPHVWNEYKILWCHPWWVCSRFRWSKSEFENLSHYQTIWVEHRCWPRSQGWFLLWYPEPDLSQKK